MKRFVAPPGPAAEDRELAMLLAGGVDFDAEAQAPPRSRYARSAQLDYREAEGRTAVPFGNLPGTRVEVVAGGDLFTSVFRRAPELLMDGRATKAAFHEHGPGKDYLHVATHGWFQEIDFPDRPPVDALWTPLGAGRTVLDAAPMSLCGLALAGANRGRTSVGRVPGVLTAEELAGVDLSECDLAVLSACETNVGPRSAGLGILSLQSAVHAAGARSAVTSLWKVDDAATRELMERFYTYLWVEKLPKAEALWRAKCDLRSAGHPKHHWAAWVLSGDPE